MGILWANALLPLDWHFCFRNDVVCNEGVVSKYEDSANDIVRAVHLLRQRGVTVGFPMQTASGEIIFAVGKDTLTADQILELLKCGELHTEGVRKLAEAQAAATPLRKKAASS